MSNFLEWAEHHSTIFGFAEIDSKMILSWEGLFAASNFTIDELNEATKTLARNPPAWPRDHLKAIQDAIKNQRQIVARHDDEVDDWNCSDCHGAGRIVVPHLDGIEGEDWRPQNVGAGPQYYTQAVACHCARGQKDYHTLPKGGKIKNHALMTFTSYEQSNPSWRRQLADRENEQREAAALVPASDSWTKLIDRMTATMKAKRAEEQR